MISDLSLSNFLANTFNVHVELVRALLVLLLSIVISPIFHLLRSKNARNMYSIVPAMFLLYYLYQQWSLYVILGPIVMYLFLLIFPKNSLLISFLFGLSYLLFIHIYSYDYQSWKIDCSTTVMFLITKFTYYGQYLKNNKNNQDHTFIDYLGYCYFFPSICGPTFSFASYLDFIHLRNNYASLKFRMLNSIILLIFGGLLMVVSGLAIPIFTNDWPNTNQFYQSLNVPAKLLCLNIIGFFYRVKFYGAWMISQVAINFSGISWNGKDAYDHINAGSIKYQYYKNPKQKTQFWNSSIQKWLKDVVYDSISQKTKNVTISLYLTFFVTALWHGIYITYYAGFFLWAIVMYLTKWVYKWSLALPRKVTESKITSFIVFMLSSTIMNYIGMIIVILDWQKSWKFTSDLQYSIPIILFVALFASLIITPPKVKGKNQIKVL